MLPISSFLFYSSLPASLEAESIGLGSASSSQDSLHKAPKKKGIKSSIGRLFGKKEKARLGQLSKELVISGLGHWSTVIFVYVFASFLFSKWHVPLLHWQNLSTKFHYSNEHIYQEFGII